MKVRGIYDAEANMSDANPSVPKFHAVRTRAVATKFADMAFNLYSICLCGQAIAYAKVMISDNRIDNFDKFILPMLISVEAISLVMLAFSLHKSVIWRKSFLIFSISILILFTIAIVVCVPRYATLSSILFISLFAASLKLTGSVSDMTKPRNP